MRIFVVLRHQYGRSQVQPQTSLGQRKYEARGQRNYFLWSCIYSIKFGFLLNLVILSSTLTVLSQGTPSASQETSQAPRADSISSRLPADGQTVTHYMEEKSAPQRKGCCDSCDFIILPYSLFNAS